jgi:signal recognition particle subunit SRP54
VFDILTKKFSSLFASLTSANKITEASVADTVSQIKDVLLEADVPYAVVEAFLGELSKRVVGERLVKSLKPAEQFMGHVYDVMCQFMGGDPKQAYTFNLPATVLVMGLQGSGKTTTIAKLAHYTKIESGKRGKKSSILLASVDFYRPAAIDQLEILAAQVGVPFYRAVSIVPSVAASEIMAYAKEHGFRLLLLDTAGRLHMDNLMLQELRDIDTVVSARHKLLVLDAMTGQESLAVASAFDQAVGFEAAILTKMDSDTRGGAAFAFRYMLKKPIVYVGAGEKIGDLAPFNPVRAVGRMLGRGDLLTLAEKADSTIKQSDQERALKAFTRGNFTLEDFASQMDMVKSLGSLSSIMQYLPGMSDMQLSRDKMEQGEKEMRRFRAVIGSMTPKERLNPDIIDGQRKARIAKGAGASVNDITILLDRFKQSQQYVKLLKKSGLFKGMLR